MRDDIFFGFVGLFFLFLTGIFLKTALRRRSPGLVCWALCQGAFIIGGLLASPVPLALKLLGVTSSAVFSSIDRATSVCVTLWHDFLYLFCVVGTMQALVIGYKDLTRKANTERTKTEDDEASRKGLS